MKTNYKRLKLACYMVNITMAFAGNISPILFLTIRSLYGVSYSLLGLLVVINFATQLTVDLIFSFFSHKFNIPAVVRTMPFLTIIGFLIFALVPTLAPQYAYIGIAIGTVISSAAAGLAEVLISPIVASIPSDDPDRQMSGLHAVYAWGAVGVVILGTLFLLAFGKQNWYILVLLFLLIPIISAILFFSTNITCVHNAEKSSGVGSLLKKPALWASVVGIFLGGATEVTMAQWSSSYLENALGIDKVWGDVFGVAMFSVTLGVGRTLYSKIGKNITRVLLFGAIGAAACYFVAAISNIAIVGLVACALTGLCASMMWPGSLVIATDRFAAGGVVVFALMAAGGDMGAAIVPQLVGVAADSAVQIPALQELAASLSLAPDQLGLKIGMLIGMLFPLAAIPVYYILHKHRIKT